MERDESHAAGPRNSARADSLKASDRTEQHLASVTIPSRQRPATSELRAANVLVQICLRKSHVWLTAKPSIDHFPSCARVRGGAGPELKAELSEVARAQWLHNIGARVRRDEFLNIRHDR
jgi:hypothetical protein